MSEHAAIKHGRLEYQPSAEPQNRVVLISNEVMHYRVSVYNYFHRRFRESGYEFSVLTDRLQKQNQNRPQFELREIPFSFFAYRKAILDLRPTAVILFLHMKDLMFWPLMHWLKLRNIPFAFWTKGGNWDVKDSKIRFHLFNYVHGISDGLILYSDSCREYLKPHNRGKAFVANNTVNFEDYPTVREGKEEIRKEFGIPFSKSVILIGRLGVDKGRKRVDHLIEIFRGLDRRDIGLVLVGSGLTHELKARMNPANTIHLGEVHDPNNVQISKLCKMADVCAIPGHVGLGLNQAFYWGLPVITEEGDHPPEIAYLKPGRNGFIVPRDDLGALKERILYLLDNDELRAQFSQHAREDITANASIEGMFSGFRECVEYLAALREIRQQTSSASGRAATPKVNTRPETTSR
jgi:glycosyltransferase involved in cell wall biosynthesis